MKKDEGRVLLKTTAYSYHWRSRDLVNMVYSRVCVCVFVRQLYTFLSVELLHINVLFENLQEKNDDTHVAHYGVVTVSDCLSFTGNRS